MELLKTIDSPADLRQLPASQLPQLAAELREYILTTVTKHGGHLSSNLGTVELAIALHYVFDTPRDALVWDVGHQAYAHKVLTGRRERLSGVRQLDGISGFPQRDESEYDAFGTAHASTSISAAFGMAAGGCPGKAIAIVGDGALSGGMAFEALNNAGARQDIDLLVVVNDNDMSISPAVGALRQNLARILASNFYNRVKRGSGQVMPPGIREFLSKAEEHLRGMVMPGTFFEELGFSYFGPIDGHDVDTLTETLAQLKDRSGPRLLPRRDGQRQGLRRRRARSGQASRCVSPAGAEQGRIRSAAANLFRRLRELDLRCGGGGQAGPGGYAGDARGFRPG